MSTEAINPAPSLDMWLEDMHQRGTVVWLRMGVQVVVGRVTGLSQNRQVAIVATERGPVNVMLHLVETYGENGATK